MTDSVSFIVMVCGCEIGCNVEPTRDGDRRRVQILGRADLISPKTNIVDPSMIGPEIVIEAVGGFNHWREIQSFNLDRDHTPSAHEFIRDQRSTITQRGRASTRFGATRGKVPRCWIEKSGTV